MLGLALAALLAASPPQPLAETKLPAPDAVVAIPPELREQLRARVVDRTNVPELRLRLLVDFMFDPDGMDLRFDDQRTRTAAEAFAMRKANCLSFTLLFVALAREAGLDAYVQETAQIVTWYEEAGTVYNAGHVNAGVRIGPKRTTIDINRSVLMTRSLPQAISDERALSHFYNNRGAELMRDGDLAAARAHLLAGVAVAREPFLAVWNNLGVLEMREGRKQEAERSYLTALRRDPEYAATLLNLWQFYQRNGAPARAAEFQRRLEQAQLADPFHQFVLAVESEKNGDPEGAIAHYRRAIKLHRTEHRFHLGLARAYEQKGDLRRARKSLLRARDLADEELRGIYQAKLDRLGRRIASK